MNLLYNQLMNKTLAKKSARVLFIREEFELFIYWFCLILRTADKTPQTSAPQGFTKDWSFCSFFAG
jgi:hypothetical protein